MFVLHTVVLRIQINNVKINNTMLIILIFLRDEYSMCLGGCRLSFITFITAIQMNTYLINHLK
jgi:hypothetical protein